MLYEVITRVCVSVVAPSKTIEEEEAEAEVLEAAEAEEGAETAEGEAEAEEPAASPRNNFV